MQINTYIDHTLLKAQATSLDIEQLINQAEEYNFYAICVQGCWVAYAKERLKNTEVKIATVVGFPLGGTSTEAKISESMNAVFDGADEIDMVMNIGWALSNMWCAVKADIEKVVISAKIAELMLSEKVTQIAQELENLHVNLFDLLQETNSICDFKALLKEYNIDFTFQTKIKVIIETCLFSDEQIVKACECVKESGADFVKTSTGFSSKGASLEQVKLMRKTIGPSLGLKAAGGIRNYKEAVSFIQAGANRIGTSAGVQIMKEGKLA